MTRQNPEIFWCSSGCFILMLPENLGKEGEINCLISIYSRFFQHYSKCFYRCNNHTYVSATNTPIVVQYYSVFIYFTYYLQPV